MRKFESEMSALADGNLIASGENFLMMLSKIQGVHYRKRDFVFRSGLFRGEEIPATIQEKLTGTLVFGHGAQHFGTREKVALQLRMRSVSKVWATNISRETAKFKCLPPWPAQSC